MQIRLIAKQTIEDYCVNNTQSRTPLKNWLAAIKYADWTTANDVSSTFGSADLLGNGSNRVVFDIGGNNYRMICKFHFGRKLVHLFICWIGTHAEYNDLCKKGNQYTVKI